MRLVLIVFARWLGGALLCVAVIWTSVLVAYNLGNGYPRAALAMSLVYAAPAFVGGAGLLVTVGLAERA